MGLLFSCNDSVPSGVINQEKMQEVLRAEALSEEIFKKDSNKSVAVESATLSKKVFLIHNITEEQFQKSYSYYTSRPDILQTMLDTINARQTREMTEPSLRKGSLRSRNVNTDLIKAHE
jgi:hypothetical protein